MSLECLHAAFAERALHFAPYFLLGDPDVETSVELCRAAVRAGATQLELGIPFSDPVADGPTLQAASRRALRAGMTPGRALELLASLREESSIPLNLLIYANLVHRRGARQFFSRLAAHGGSSVLLPDVSFEESGGLRREATRCGLGYVDLCGPGTSPERVATMSRGSNAFLYLAGAQTITGARTSLARGLATRIVRAGRASSVPLCVGFGLRKPGHLREVFAHGARIAVVGSRLSDLVSTHLDEAGAVEDREALIDEVGRACRGFADVARDGSVAGQEVL